MTHVHQEGERRLWSEGNKVTEGWLMQDPWEAIIKASRMTREGLSLTEWTQIALENVSVQSMQPRLCLTRSEEFASLIHLPVCPA